MHTTTRNERQVSIIADPSTQPDDPRTAAHAYAALGLRVIPIAPGHKRPAMNRWVEAATTDRDIIDAWWTGLYRGHGIGLALGAWRGTWLFAVDIDRHDTDGEAEWDALLVQHDAAEPATWTAHTGGGGRHLLFTAPREIRNGRLAPGIDIRGAGGQILVAPTVHPNGRPYAWVTAPGDADLAPAPAWLLGLLEHDDTPAPALTPRPTGDRPGDRWAADTTWAQLLEGDGWSLHHTDRDGETHWTRPGKERRDGTSATVGYRGSDVLKVFTSAIPWLTPDETYTKLGYLAARDHDGDHSAAARHLAANGYATPRPTLESLVATLPEGHIEWGDPAPLQTVTDTPSFPLEALPAWAVAHAEAVAEAIQVPVDLPASLIIGALSAATTGRLDAMPGPEWVEPVNLYLAVVMRSGAGKSPAEKACVSWLRRWQARRIEETAEARDKAVFRASGLRKKAVDAQKGYEMGSTSEDDAWDAHVRALAAEADVPPVPRVIIDDATPEAVATLLKAHSERLAIMSTEADLFDMVLGDGRRKPNINIYLKAWSGDTMTRDRKGSSDTGPEATDLTRPLLTVSAAVQPSVLERIRTDAELVGRGFVARFMLSVPPDTIGRRDHTRRFTANGLATRRDYEAACIEMADRLARFTMPARVRFDRDAQRCLNEFMATVEPQLAAAGDLAVLAEWANKCFASVARYAALLWVAEGHDTGEAIDADTCARAVTLGWYWVAHAAHAYGRAGDHVAAQATAILEWAAAEGNATFTATDLQKGCRSRRLDLLRAVDFAEPLRRLVDNSWLVVHADEGWADRLGTGSKSPNFTVWPGLHERGWRERLVRTSRVARIGGAKLSLSIDLLPPLDARDARHARQNAEAGSQSYPQDDHTIGAPRLVHDPDPFAGFYADTPLEDQ